MNDVPKGVPYNVLYAVPNGPIEDSERVRRRIATALFNAADHVSGSSAFEVSRRIEGQIGSDAPHNYGLARSADSWKSFALECSLSDLLTSVTVVAKYLSIQAKIAIDVNEARLVKTKLFELKTAVSEAFAQEGAPYWIDELCGIHPLVDRVHTSTSVAAVRALNGPRYNAARSYVDAIDDDLLKVPPDGVAAIYKTFLAAENLFKMMFQADRLMSQQITKYLRPAVLQLYEGDTKLAEISDFEVESFIKWASAALKYRHAEGESNLPSPPQEVYVLLISQGLSFVRWLAEIDRKLDAR